MATYTPDPRAYELMVLLSPELDEDGLTSEMNQIEEMLSTYEIEIQRVKSTTPWGRRRLSYPIQNYQDAFYVLYSLSSQPGQLAPFERDLKLDANVIRYLLIRQDKADEPEDEEEAAAETDDDGEAAAEAEDAPAADHADEETAGAEETEETVSDAEPADGSDDEEQT